MNVLRNLTQQLSAVYPQGEASSLARWVLEEGFGLSLTDVILGKDTELSADQQQELENIVHRLLQEEPVQYVLGRTTFCGLTLRVRPGVLIPRPETQELVAWICEENATRGDAEDLMQDGEQRKMVLDIGTGTGCIALTLAKAGFRVDAWDVSAEALAVAKENADALGLQVNFRQEDILAPSLSRGGTPKWEVIVSNPPYICQHEAEEMDRNVLAHEPHLALFVPDDDPLLFYRAIARFALQTLLPDGRLYFEINRQFGHEICQMLSDLGFTDILLRKDQFNNPRMVRASLPNP